MDFLSQYMFVFLGIAFVSALIAAGFQVRNMRRLMSLNNISFVIFGLFASLNSVLFVIGLVVNLIHLAKA